VVGDAACGTDLRPVDPSPSGRTGRFEVEFDEPQAAVAPGQAVVLYDGDRVLGGGWIESSRKCVA